MREEARIQIRGDKVALQNAWNSRFDPKIEYGLVVLYKDDAPYSQLRRLFDSLLREHVMTWHEQVHAEYSQQELESFELLRWIITGRAGPGDNTYGPVYAVKEVCSECGRVSYGQARDLILDLALEEQDSQELGYFRHDVCRTDAGEILVSDRVRHLLESQGMTGATIRPIDAIRASREGKQEYYQLVVEAETGELWPPTRVLRGYPCPICGRHKEVLLDALPGSKESEFYLARESLPDASIMRTSEEFGRGPTYTSEVIIRQDIYHVLHGGKVTGFWVEPVHLVEGES